MMSLKINLGNQWPLRQPLYASITGLINETTLVFISGTGAQYPVPSPSEVQATGAPTMALPTASTSIALPAQGGFQTLQIPPLTSGRVYFSVGQPLVFSATTGAAPNLATPSITNNSDPNANIIWGFCEFNYSNDSGLYANISYVDFVGMPIALDLEDTSGAFQHVGGMKDTGINDIAKALQAQAKYDKQPWDKLVQTDGSGNVLRILSPNSLITSTPGATPFMNFFEPYISNVWTTYQNQPLTIDIGASGLPLSGRFLGKVSSDNIFEFSAAQPNSNIGTASSPSEVVAKVSLPSTAAIFNTANGAFQHVANDIEGAINAILCAGFNRSTLLLDPIQPDGQNAGPTTYYGNSAPTNQYAKIVHLNNVDGKGYAFPYDDVTATGQTDVSGKVTSATPVSLTITPGGAGAHP